MGNGASQQADTATSRVLQLAPSFGFKERWFAQKFNRKWNPVTEKLDTSIQKGFYAAREMTMGLTFSTAVFGTYQAKNKEARVQAIRHVMRPQMSINLPPPCYGLEIRLQQKS